ncbi:hypothetical protein B0H19DRAFT_1250083 [Mycena capillaripes]|nr:hypothetical protein B0H19DRAFT_1250083 [Mycena capillaripes]
MPTINLPNAESKEVVPSHNLTPSAAKRTHYQMVGSILIPNEEGVRWFEQTYGRKLRKDHRADASVRLELERILTEEEGQPLDVEYAPHRDAPWHDFLAATQFETGMKGDSAREEEMRKILRKLGLQPGEFKCYSTFDCDLLFHSHIYSLSRA